MNVFTFRAISLTRRIHGRQQGRARGGECPLLDFENDDIDLLFPCKLPSALTLNTLQFSLKCQTNRKIDDFCFGLYKMSKFRLK